MVEAKNKYDRQLRIWGEHGQDALEMASICLLNCGPTGSEILKNLVLGGVGSITIVDGSKVEEGDLGNNFMLDVENVGQSKAKCVCFFLKELNDSVKAKFVEEPPDVLIETKPSFFHQFTLIIATQFLEASIIKLDNICRQANVMLICARAYGLCGLLRVSLKEHDVIETKPDHFRDDLRLHNPWPDLKQFAGSINLDTTDPVVHKHIPYVIILIKMAEQWSNTHGGRLPSSREEKKEFKDLLKSKMLGLDEENYKEAIDASFRISASPGISLQLRQILDDSQAEVTSSSSDFWVLVAALKEFINNEGKGEVPLEGSLPDMTSSTECYIHLQKLYQAKADADFLVVENHVKSILRKIGRNDGDIPKSFIKSFCKNSRKLCVCRYRKIEEEFRTPAMPRLHMYLTDEEYSACVGFYILLRAVDRFVSNYNRFPGLFESEIGDDVSRLKSIAITILCDLGCNGSVLSEDLVSEMCRYGGAELHVIAAFVGGVASQEAIKLITKQFIPMVGTFIFNGVNQKSQLLAL